ncbi:hypothetical protein RSAG8_09384, partial [Rhizoctonia solani AG-8 WAC10335]
MNSDPDYHASATLTYLAHHLFTTSPTRPYRVVTCQLQLRCQIEGVAESLRRQGMPRSIRLAN